MSIDTDAYMSWWMRGANGAYGDRDEPPRLPTEDAFRGYAAGRAAYLAAEQAERERLSHEDDCQDCLGTGWTHVGLSRVICPVCHGTKRRP